ncbi:MAG: hypothetical protein U0487_03180 [Patescibacteria group bacterium]
MNCTTAQLEAAHQKAASFLPTTNHQNCGSDSMPHRLGQRQSAIAKIDVHMVKGFAFGFYGWSPPRLPNVKAIG